MGSGFLVSNNAGNTALTAVGWTAVTLAFNVTGEPKSAPPVLPGKIHAWTVELDLNTIAGAGTVQGGVTYNATATKTVNGESSASTITVYTGAVGSAAIGFNGGVEINWPEGTYTIGNPTLTLWLKLNAGTANLSANGARLQYTESPNG